MHKWQAGLALAILAPVAVAICLPIMPARYPRGLRNQRLSNLKQVSLAQLIYTTDYNGHLPPVQWRPAVMPYLKNQEILEDRKSEFPYITAQRASLSEVNVEKIARANEVAMLLDVSESSDPFVAELPAMAYRKTGTEDKEMATLAFADGHVKVLGRKSTTVVR
ncbi:hypothetical protein EON81_07495 [bacterium]|nr:MAG: hypothetical protein EON81_07495 [bacterium]